MFARVIHCLRVSQLFAKCQTSGISQNGSDETSSDANIAACTGDPIASIDGKHLRESNGTLGTSYGAIESTAQSSFQALPAKQVSNSRSERGVDLHASTPETGKGAHENTSQSMTAPTFEEMQSAALMGEPHVRLSDCETSPRILLLSACFHSTQTGVNDARARRPLFAEPSIAVLAAPCALVSAAALSPTLHSHPAQPVNAADWDGGTQYVVAARQYAVMPAMAVYVLAGVAVVITLVTWVEVARRWQVGVCENRSPPARVKN